MLARGANMSGRGICRCLLDGRLDKSRGISSNVCAHGSCGRSRRRRRSGGRGGRGRQLESSESSSLCFLGLLVQDLGGSTFFFIRSGFVPVFTRIGR